MDSVSLMRATRLFFVGQAITASLSQLLLDRDRAAGATDGQFQPEHGSDEFDAFPIEPQ